MEFHELLNVAGWKEYDAGLKNFWMSRNITSLSCSYATTIEKPVCFHVGQVFLWECWQL